MVLMASCAKDDAITPSTAESTKFYASIEAPATRTSVDGEGKLSWSANDKITVFKGDTYARQYKYKGETDGGSVFEEVISQGSSTTELTANYSIYPYAANTTISNDGKISYTIPATQKYAVNSFGLGANPMVAVTKNKNDNFLAFKNLCGYFEFSLYGNVAVKSIEFKGNNGEKLAGKATITATNQDAPTFIFANDATETLTLDCGTGIQLGANADNATKFWFVVPAITYSKGITITITDIYGGTMEKSTSNSITINRSTVQPLDAFEVETIDANTPPNNQIWYTSTDGQIVNPYSKSFGATITSNVYENGKGIITFNGDVTKIGNTAFNSCKSLTSIIIPNSAISIGYSAFYNCSSLISITIPNSVTSVGNGAFKYCKALASIILPNNITSIENETFYGCSSLTSISIPDCVTTIGREAMRDCELLREITFGNGNINIDSNAFYGCNTLSTFYGDSISADNRCLIVDGVLKAFAPAALTRYTIPSGVTAIGDYVFINNKYLIDITIPNGVISIGKYAFGYCNSMKSINIPNSVVSIGEETFYECKSLENINLPNSITSIGDGAFNGCESLTDITIPNKVSTIGDWTFAKCKSLTTIYIPNSVTSIGKYSFNECKSLNNITIPNNVSSIGMSAFEKCRALKSITIPNSVASIGGYAFSYCTTIENVTLSNNITTIESNLFAHCYSLTTITIPDNITSIESLAFYYCESLKSITIPNNVNSIEMYSFKGCTSLASIFCKSTTPSQLGTEAFANTSSNIRIYVPNSSVTDYKVAGGWKDYADKIVGYDFSNE